MPPPPPVPPSMGSSSTDSTETPNQSQSLDSTTSTLTSGLAETATTTVNTVASSESTSTNTNRNNTSLLPLILAPILAIFGFGGLYFLWRHFYKRRKARHMAPSAEFQKYRRRSIPLADVEGGSAAGAAAAEGMQPMDSQAALYTHRNDGGEIFEAGNNGPPPSFALGLFKDPLFEKGVAISLANQSGRYR